MEKKTMDHEVDFGDLLKEWREQLGISQAELQMRTGINRTALSKLEARGSNPTLATATKIIEGLNLSVPKFFNLNEEDTKPKAPFIEVVFGPDETEKKYKEALVKKGFPVPIVTTPEALLDKRIREDDVRGFTLFDEHFIRAWRGDRQAPYNCEGIVVVITDLCGFRMIVVDVLQDVFKSHRVYLVNDHKESFLVRAWQMVEGVLLHRCQGVGFGDDSQDDAQSFMLVRQRTSRIRVLGRVVGAALAF